MCIKACARQVISRRNQIVVVGPIWAVLYRKKKLVQFDLNQFKSKKKIYKKMTTIAKSIPNKICTVLEKRSKFELVKWVNIFFAPKKTPHFYKVLGTKYNEM